MNIYFNPISAGRVKLFKMVMELYFDVCKFTNFVADSKKQLQNRLKKYITFFCKKRVKSLKQKMSTIR